VADGDDGRDEVAVDNEKADHQEDAQDLHFGRRVAEAVDLHVGFADGFRRKRGLLNLSLAL
jgi:hypothetical protein